MIQQALGGLDCSSHGNYCPGNYQHPSASFSLGALSSLPKVCW